MFRKKIIIIFFAVACMLIYIYPVKADIYRYIDSKGVLHFSNVPVSSEYTLFISKNPPKSTEISFSNKFDSHIRKASKKYRVPFYLLKALIKAESDFNPNAVSRAGAKGLMQIMPKNFKSLNIDDPFDPKENIFGGTLYLRHLLELFDGKLPLALAAYNAGPNAVNRYKKIPPYPETINYVNKVMKYYSIFRK